MVKAVLKQKGNMIGPEGIKERVRNIYRIILIVLVFFGFQCFLIVDKGFAQVSPNTVSYAYTGNIIPATRGFTTLLPGDGIRAGSFRVHLFLGAAEVYTDNAFRNNTNRQSDFIHTVSPGVQIQLPFAGLHQVVFDYRASQLFSQRFALNNVLRQDLTGQMLLNFPGGLNMRFQGGYRKGFDLRGSAVDVQALEPTKWNTKTFLSETEKIGSQFGVRLRVQITDWNFENNNQAPRRDRLSSRGDFTVFGLVAPKTFLLLNFGVSQQSFDQNTQLNSLSYRVSSGLRWQATGKTSGEIQVGYEFLNFDRAPVIQPTGSPLSSGGNGSKNLRITGNLNWNATARSRIQLRPFRRIRQSGVFSTTTFTQTGVRLSGRYAIGTRTTLSANLQYANNDFKNDQSTQTSQNRTDDTLRGNIGATYKAVRWLGLRVQYQYDQRDSTTSRFEFYANTLMVSIQGVF